MHDFPHLLIDFLVALNVLAGIAVVTAMAAILYDAKRRQTSKL